MSQKGFSGIIALFVVLIIGVAGGTYYFGKSQVMNTQSFKFLDQNVQVDIPVPVGLAKKDLGKTLGVDESQIILEKMEKVEWRDSSLGCPKEGKVYAGVITAGYKAVFSYQQNQYEYHTDNSGSFIQCQSK